jgi:hypothetical protein
LDDHASAQNHRAEKGLWIASNLLKRQSYGAHDHAVDQRHPGGHHPRFLLQLLRAVFGTSRPTHDGWFRIAATIGGLALAIPPDHRPGYAEADKSPSAPLALVEALLLRPLMNDLQSRA